MSWKRFFSPVSQSGVFSPLGGPNNNGVKTTNYSSYLPDIYTGSPNRIERYLQYDTMDMDSEVNAALDIISEFSTQENVENGTPFWVNFRDKASSTEVKLIRDYLQKWCRLQQFEIRMFRLFRNTIKYGDSFFIRDPETKKWFYIDPGKLVKIIVNESDGKKPEQYVIRDLNPNFLNLVTTQINPSNQNTQPGGTAYVTGGAGARGMTGAYPQQSGTRFSQAQNEFAIDAKHVVHLSLSEGLDNNYPFGNSLLESVFKVFKQKELLEDAIIIYRVQRAPERRVFYLDVGNMPSHMAMQFVERVKNEIHQRRIPSATGGGQSVVDASYNPLCLDLETLIPLLDGRTLPLREIIAEFNSGKENWAYSCDPLTGKVVPGVINWAGVTRKNTEVIKITLDNGKQLIVTPDHKIPVFGRGFIEAKDLTQNDSLIAFNTRNQKVSPNGNTYQQVWDHESKSWEWTHRIVGEFFRNLNKHQEFTYLEEHINSHKATIHHKDNNRFNNDPRNLTYMNKEDHILYHDAQKSTFWETMSDDYQIKMTSKISNTLKENWKNLTEEERVKRLWNIRSAQKKSIWLRQNDLDVASRYKTNASKSRKEFLSNNPEFLDKLKKQLNSRVKIKNQQLNLTFEMLQHVVDKVKLGITNKNDIIDLCDNDATLLALIKEENSKLLDYKNTQYKIDFTKFGNSKLKRLISKFGYKNWKSFVKDVNCFNHKIVSIESVPNIDTGTITIDGQEKWHNYHTFAVDCGIFIKNSINEDYFFPQTAEGRGSKVETLPGGTNLGEIDDLRFFTNKLFRALRIPSSYLPTGPDDSAAVFSDGRVGTAYIQELRFNKYCERIQSLIEQEFNLEFKLYMKDNGIVIDDSLFDIQFNPPQNFAAYRLSELDSARVQTFTTMQEVPYMSKRFAMKRYLGLSQEEIVENERLWREENREIGDGTGAQAELRGMGITAGGLDQSLEEPIGDEELEMEPQAGAQVMPTTAQSPAPNEVPPV